MVLRDGLAFDSEKRVAGARRQHRGVMGSSHRLGWKAMPLARDDLDSNYCGVREAATQK